MVQPCREGAEMLVLRGRGLPGEAELAVVTVWITSPREVLDAARTGAEDSIFECPDTDRAVVED